MRKRGCEKKKEREKERQRERERETEGETERGKRDRLTHRDTKGH